MTARLESALRWAAVRHHGQTRRGCDAPYVEHLLGVALILDRLGFDEDVVIAGLLHDAVEDTGATPEDIEARFGPSVASVVRHCSEQKTDAEGRKRPWTDRKRDHLEAVADAPLAARAVLLADKLHNLVSIEVDLREGQPIWSHFHAERDEVLWYYRAMIDRLGTGEARLEHLADRCREALAAVESL
jgi:(p)ppGpp synthase/HD superfamily hydrolase